MMGLSFLLHTHFIGILEQVVLNLKTKGYLGFQDMLQLSQLLTNIHQGFDITVGMTHLNALN